MDFQEEERLNAKKLQKGRHLWAASNRQKDSQITFGGRDSTKKSRGNHRNSNAKAEETVDEKNTQHSSGKKKGNRRKPNARTNRSLHGIKIRRLKGTTFRENERTGVKGGNPSLTQKTPLSFKIHNHPPGKGQGKWIIWETIAASTKNV